MIYDKVKKLYSTNFDKIKNLNNAQKQLDSEQKHVFFDINFLGSLIDNDITITNIKNKLKQRLKNQILIKKGEIPFEHEFGSNIYNQLYKQDTELDYNKIKEYLEELTKQTLKNDIIFDKVLVNRRNIENDIYEVDVNKVVLDIEIHYEIPLISNDILSFTLNQHEREE